MEKAKATHSSVLAWRIPATGEPGGLPSVGSNRVGHDWSDLAAAAVLKKNSIYSILNMTIYWWLYSFSYSTLFSFKISRKQESKIFKRLLVFSSILFIFFFFFSLLVSLYKENNKHLNKMCCAVLCLGNSWKKKQKKACHDIILK